MRLLRSGGAVWRAGAGVAAALVVAVVVVLVTPREAGEGDLDDGIGIEIGVAGDGGVGGVAAGPGPSNGPSGGGAGGPGDGTVPVPAPTGTGTGVASTSVLRLPNLQLTFRTLMAQVDGADSTFVYRAAVEARDAGEYAVATGLFRRVQAAGGPLAPFAEFRAAQMTGLASEPAAAADSYAALLAAGGAAEALPGSVRPIALSEGADALEAAGRTDEALAALEQVATLDVGSSTLAESLWRRAEILQAAGAAGWEDLAIQAMTIAPGSTASQDALDLLDASSTVGYPQMEAAYTEYRSFRNDAAVTRYEGLLASGTLELEDAGTAWFYLGALRERAFDREGALEAYANSAAVAPDGALADDAIYWRGRVLEELERPDEAVVEYDRLVASFPDSSFAEESELRAAVALGIAGLGAASTERLASITQTAAPSTAAEAAHWHAVLVALFGAPPASIAPAATYDPTSYAAAFEQSGTAVTGPLPDSALGEVPERVPADRAAVQAWLAAQTGADATTPSEARAILEEGDVELGWLLAEAGEDGVARGLLNAAVFAHRDEPAALVELAYEAQSRGLHDVALNAANVILDAFEPSTRLSAPRALLALAYPVPYLEEATEAAAEFEVPVLLMYALMRQESAFHPSAGSSAGAFGLTQVIEPTGASIAGALGVEGWTFADLASPSVATRFGAFYLAEQLESFDGHMLAALAAYNGGPGNASRWLDAQGFEGPDGYLYAVDFTETRAYLEHVSSNYAMYRYLYAGTELPRLPHGE